MSWYFGAADLVKWIREVARPVGGREDEYYAAMKQLDIEIELLEKVEIDNIDDRLRIKYYAARRIWPIRDKCTPNDRTRTWAQWFGDVFRSDLASFAAKCESANVKNKIIAYEVNKFGWSPLEDQPVRKVAG